MSAWEHILISILGWSVAGFTIYRLQVRDMAKARTEARLEWIRSKYLSERPVQARGGRHLARCT